MPPFFARYYGSALIGGFPNLNAEKFCKIIIVSRGLNHGKRLDETAQYQ